MGRTLTLGALGFDVLVFLSDSIAALGGKITPSDEARIRAEARAGIIKAGGTAADVAETQRIVTVALQPYGGSTLPQYGGSIWPSYFRIELPWLLGGAAAVAALILLTRR